MQSSCLARAEQCRLPDHSPDIYKTFKVKSFGLSLSLSSQFVTFGPLHVGLEPLLQHEHKRAPTLQKDASNCITIFTLVATFSDLRFRRDDGGVLVMFMQIAGTCNTTTID